MLERRDCLSTLTLCLTPGTLQNVTLSGNLTDAPKVACQTIDFGGQVAPGIQTKTDAHGHYCITVQATALGKITAQTDDQLSNIAAAMLASPPPIVQNFDVYESYYVWTFTGKVIAPSPAGVTLTLFDGGTLQNTPVRLAPDGTFSYSVRLNPKVDNGLVTATATDVWGQSGYGETLLPT